MTTGTSQAKPRYEMPLTQHSPNSERMLTVIDGTVYESKGGRLTVWVFCR